MQARTKQMIQGFGLAGVLAALLPVPSLAQFLGMSWVIDPTAIAKIAAETQEVVKVAETSMNTYQFAVMQARFFTNKQAWMSNPMIMVQSFPTSGASDPGTGIGWLDSVNRQVDSVGAATSRYGSVAIRLYSNPAADVVAWQNAHYNSAMIHHDSNVAAMQTLGRIRMQQAQMARAVANCQGMALSTAPENNGAGTQQNISNACASLLLQNSGAQISVETQRLELELARSKEAADEATAQANMETTLAQSQSKGGYPGRMAASMAAYNK